MDVEAFAKLWYQFSKELKMYMEKELAPLTESQLFVLEYLLTHKQEQMKASDLIQVLTITPAAVTTLLDRMEKNGLILRQRDQKDRRIVWIVVTDKGEKERERGKEVRKSFFASRLNRISEHNQKLLMFLIRKMVSSEAD